MVAHQLMTKEKKEKEELCTKDALDEIHAPKFPTSVHMGRYLWFWHQYLCLGHLHLGLLILPTLCIPNLHFSIYTSVVSSDHHDRFGTCGSVYMVRYTGLGMNGSISTSVTHGSVVN